MKDLIVTLEGQWEGTLLPYKIKIPCEDVTRDTEIKRVELVDEMSQFPIFQQEFNKLISCETTDGALVFEAMDRVFPFLHIIVSIDDGKKVIVLP